MGKYFPKLRKNAQKLLFTDFLLTRSYLRNSWKIENFLLHRLLTYQIWLSENYEMFIYIFKKMYMIFRIVNAYTRIIFVVLDWKKSYVLTLILLYFRRKHFLIFLNIYVLDGYCLVSLVHQKICCISNFANLITTTL